MDFFHALSGVFSVLAVCLTGLVLDKWRWFPRETRNLLPRLVTCVALPPYLFFSIVDTLRREDITDFLIGAVVPFVSILLTFLAACLLAKLFGVSRRRVGLFCASFATSSAIFIGIPVCDALFGHAGIPAALVYYFANALFFWTIGSYLIASDASDAGARTDTGGRTSPRRLLKNVFSPPFIGFTLGVITALLSIEPPEFVMKATQTIGQLTTPMALLYIGITLSNMRLSMDMFSRDLLLAAVGRLLICPLITAAVVLAFGVDGLMGKVFILQASLPAVLQAAIMSAHYRTDPEFGTLVISLTTVLSVITIPILMCLL